MCKLRRPCNFPLVDSLVYTKELPNIDIFPIIDDFDHATDGFRKPFDLLKSRRLIVPIKLAFDHFTTSQGPLWSFKGGLSS